MKIPTLRKLNGNVHHVEVNGRPVLLRAGELNNSSLSSSEWMQHVWPSIVQNNLNTLLGAVSWAQIEPDEGQFDFSELDKVIRGARENGLYLILLWFGSHKNGQAAYAPGWVKTNPKRFPRAQISKDGALISTATLSVFSEETAKADAAACHRLLQHIREVDSRHDTVIMIQVENEPGLLADTRDRSILAEKAFSAPVPPQFVAALANDWSSLNEVFKKNFSHCDGLANGKTWEETFGISDQTDELFMAYHYATFVEKVAASGKQAYNLPMFTNAWLRNLPDNDEDTEVKTSELAGGVRPGDYPSGGPVETVLDVWQLCAPSLDFLAPDIYLSNYSNMCRYFTHRDQALFIPEQRRDLFGALRIWEAIGRHNAIVTSPFGIDSHHPDLSPFTLHYGLLRDVSHIILQARTDGRQTFGFFFDEFKAGEKDPSPAKRATMGSWDLEISRQFVPGHPAYGFGMINHKGGDSFYLIGEGYHVKFTSTERATSVQGVLYMDEKAVNDDGTLRTVRRLNGDELGSRGGVIMPSTKPDMGDFFIESFIPAKTRIAECGVYSVRD